MANTLRPSVAAATRARPTARVLAGVPGRDPSHAVRAFLARTFHGMTLRRFAIFCAIVALAAAGHSIAMALMPDRSKTAASVFAWEFAYLLVFFGATALAVVIAGNWAPARARPRVIALVGAVLVGLVAGSALGHLLVQTVFPSGKGAMSLTKQISAIALWSHVIAAGVLVYYFLLREEDAAARMHHEDLRRVALERELTEARLLVMQAQIEPHFLFNTLANVRRLFHTDPTGGRAMLAHLSRYLSALLPRMRSQQSTLGHELVLALAYLEVQKIRMGPRLAIRVDVPDALRAAPFPPMMLVTLVENAIRHGLNPVPAGGKVAIMASMTDGRMRVQVRDTGRGLAESTGSGVGLANIRARLTTLYEGRARLLLAQPPGSGALATIELPADFEAAGMQAA